MRHGSIFGVCAVVLTGLGCSARVGRVPAATVLHDVLDERDNRVGTFVSSPWGFETSSYWIEGPDGLVLIDTQFLPSAAAKAVDWAETVTGKQVKLAFVLHANPDKFDGTATLQRRGIRVITSEQVKRLIPAVHQKRLGWFYDRYKPDYPKETPEPEAFGSRTQVIRAAGLELTAHVLGPGCSEAHVVVEVDGHIFVGDLVANGAHSWLEIGKTDQWLERLDELAALAPRYVHPGRGPSGGPELIARERAYLERLMEIVAASKPTLPIVKGTIMKLRKQVEAAFPGYLYTVFLRTGLPAEYARQAKLRQASLE